MERFDALVIGGGLVGSAVAFGLTESGMRVLVLDEGDVALRASRGNFGLVWSQSKGLGAPHYHRWARTSAAQWPALAARLAELTGVDVGLEQPGGLHFCLSDAELSARADMMARMQQEAGEFGFDYRMLTRQEAAERVPGLGRDVVGASWTPYDGHVGPLPTLRAFHAAIQLAGGVYRPLTPVQKIDPAPNDFRIALPDGGVAQAPRLVLAAGLGNIPLLPVLGLDCHIAPQRGQVLVTERARPLLSMPTLNVRQTAEGSIMIGDSKEEAAFDSLTQRPAVMRTMAERAVRCFPWLAELQIVRAWAAVRILPEDGLPIYDQPAQFPGAFAFSCHSGVGLAAAHARVLAPMVAQGKLSGDCAQLSSERFQHV